MSGNSFGRLFVVSTFGESHGPALGAVVDGCPPGLELCEADLQFDLDRRRPGQSRHTTQRREPDQVRILSGVFEGRTTGTPIGLLIENVDQRSKDYSEIMDRFRPGHADYTYHRKYGSRDYRGGGRSSARETALRVAAGGIARRYLQQRYGIEIRGWLSQLGPIELEAKQPEIVNDNPFFCPDPDKVAELEEYMDALRKSGDSIGARVTVEAVGVPAGWGEPVFDRLDAELAHALMSINAVKGVEIGAGFESVTQRGTEHRDEITPRVSCRTTPAACWAVSAPARPCARASRSSRPPASACPGAASTPPGSRWRWSPRAAMTPAWGSARPRSRRR